MSSKDKTRDKLLGSMRRTKAVANEPEMAETPATSTKPEAKKTVKKETRKPSKTTAKEEKIEYFQSVHRVWPD
jgi:hypothetical protein